MSDKTMKQHLKEIAPKGAKATNAQLRGTETAKNRAAAAAKARWDKYYEEHPEKRPKGK